MRCRRQGSYTIVARAVWTLRRGTQHAALDFRTCLSVQPRHSHGATSSASKMQHTCSRYGGQEMFRGCMTSAFQHSTDRRNSLPFFFFFFNIHFKDDMMHGVLCALSTQVPHTAISKASEEQKRKNRARFLSWRIFFNLNSPLVPIIALNNCH